ncbi:MerR family transcriptional regulator [Thermomonospora cellulosilytica]|uniref:MerR family transcriptional regulator n=1 Tax=Thermomonospora cellulosilytica TaxID=1411118 RepID=UPI001FE5E170|nr:MerR family transcriptional regulator [Thermomonospora cellulosilytica]
MARAAGVSTQQIRNYEDAGILPPAPRTASGHRRYDDRHMRALLAYRALLRGFGPVHARAIMQAVHEGDVAGALAVVDACHAALHEERRSLQATSEALEIIARRGPDAAGLPRSGMRIGEVAALLRVRTSALRVWEAAGLLAPGREPGTGYRWFGPAEVGHAQMIKMLRDNRYPLDQIRPIMDRLRRTGGTEELHAAVARRREELTRRAAAMLAGAARLHDHLSAAREDAVPAQ